MNKPALLALSTSLVAGLLFDVVLPASALAAVSTQSNSGLVNFAPSSVIETTTDGPADSQFQQLETQYNAPLTGGTSWHAFLRQTGRDITVTLPQNTNVQTISIQMEQNASSGIYYPSHVDFEANYGGQWYKVASQGSVIPLTDKRVTTETFVAHLNGLQTNQIRIHIPVGVWVFARRLEVWGTPAASGAELPSGSTLVPGNTGQPLHNYDSGSHGIKNMLLVYTGEYGSSGTWSPSDFAPMVGYTPQGGQVTSPMFDTILFLPFGNLSDTQQSWQNYINDLFTPGQELDALNTAVGQQNQQLGTYGQKEKVVLTIPYPKFGDGSWGTIGGQNISFNSSARDATALTAREQAVNWYVHTLLSDWNQAAYPNLQLAGLYWYSEQVDYSAPGEVSLIENTANLVHQNGYGFFWIPFYDASGLTSWQKLGFDAAWLQPNYMEQGSSADISRVQNADAYAKQLGLGVELEVSGGVSNSTVQSLYSQTINQMESDGMADNVSHAYYDSTKSFLTSETSTDAATRSIYDETYSFIQHP